MGTTPTKSPSTTENLLSTFFTRLPSEESSPLTNAGVSKDAGNILCLTKSFSAHQTKTKEATPAVAPPKESGPFR